MSQSKSQGFSLIELIVVIVIVGILATMTTSIITLPVNSYLDLQRRTTLVDTAELTLRRMQRDIRRALPNSVRITGGTVIEMLHVVEGGRYRSQLDTTPSAVTAGCGTVASDVLDFTSADTCFEVTGSLTVFNPTATATPAESLVIYNLGSGTADAYSGSNRTTVTNSSNAKVIALNPSLRFPFSSPQQRFFIVDTPITYRCASNQLLRYSGYAIAAAQPNPPSVTGQIQADKIDSCLFAYSPGSASRSGLVTLTITLTDAKGESVQLMHQVHVDNLP